MRSFKRIRILSLLLMMFSLIWPYATTAEAQTSTLTLLPASMSTQSGSTGGQPVSALRTKDQSGKADDPKKYVLFTTPQIAYKGTQVFNIPEQVTSASVNAFELRVNFKGPARSTQKWTWSIYNANGNSWDQVGLNPTSKSTSWTLLKFQVSHPGVYFGSGNQIRIMLVSNNDNGDAKIDSEVINVTLQTPVSPSQASATPTLASVPTSTIVETSAPANAPPVSVTQTPVLLPTDTAAVPLTATVDPVTNTPVPVFSPTFVSPSATTGAVVAPSDTPLPTNTIVPASTNTATPLPANTATSLPTNTASLAPTKTATSLPANTATSLPTNTATSIPTATPTQNLHAASYYVATNGINSNAGTQAQPFLTIQKCLNVVQPGTVCLIRGGTYNEALSLKTSGTAAGPITIQNYNGELVTVNSGSSNTVQTTSSHQSYYVFDGLRFISSKSGGEGTPTMDFSVGWAIGTNHFPPEGNSHITLRNCYVEGEVTLFGQGNTIQNCEFNGNKRLAEAIRVEYPASTGATIANNLIHDYTGRGIWSVGGTDFTLIQRNTVYNVQHGIDCDGAGVPVTHCNVLGNTIHDVSSSSTWGSGIFLENSFNGVVSGNTVYNIPNGAGVYVINYGDGPNWHTQNNVEYRTLDLNTSITNNVVYNNPTNPGLLDISASGLQIKNNTFSNSGNVPTVYLKVEPNTTFYPERLVIRDNIFADPSASTTILIDSAASLTGSILSNNLYWTGNNTHKVGGTGYTLYGFQATGQESGSISGDPKFVKPGSDFHLQSVSPAMDKGFDTGVTSDFDGNQRPYGTAYDIGAYEFIK